MFKKITHVTLRSFATTSTCVTLSLISFPYLQTSHREIRDIQQRQRQDQHAPRNNRFTTDLHPTNAMTQNKVKTPFEVRSRSGHFSLLCLFHHLFPWIGEIGYRSCSSKKDLGLDDSRLSRYLRLYRPKPG